jgi:hypothetical protein
LLNAAQEKVSELQQQIATLETIAAEDAVDTALASKIKPVEKKSITDYMDGPVSEVIVPHQAGQFKATPTGRNPKGSVQSAMLEILSDGVERDLDYIEEKQRTILPVPITRGALRTALMTLKNEGEVVSRKQGYFQLVQKGESPAGTGLSNATESSQGQATFRA